MEIKIEDSQSTKSVSDKARNAFIWVASTSAIWQIISWIFTIFTARILSPTDFGIAALPGTFIPYLALLASLELQTWIIQTKDWNKDNAAAISTIVLILGIACTTSAYLGAPYLAQFYKDQNLVDMFRVCSFIFIINNFSLVQQAELQRELRFKEISIINLFTNIGQSIITLVLALLEYGYWSLVIGIMISYLFKTLAILYLKGLYIKPRFDILLSKNAIRYGATAASASALWIVFSTIDDITVGRLFSTTELGFYTMAYFFSQLPLSKLNMIISPVIAPYYSGLKNQGSLLKLPYLKTAKAIVAITSPSLIGLSVIANDLILLILGEKWLPAVPILQVLCLVALFQSFTINSSALFNSTGRPSVTLKQNLLSATILPAAFVCGGLLFGLPGIYYAWLVGYPFVTIFILLQLKKELQISLFENIKNLRAPLISGIAMGLTVALIRTTLNLEALPSVMISITSGALTYLALMFSLFREESLAMISLKHELNSPSA